MRPSVGSFGYRAVLDRLAEGKNRSNVKVVRLMERDAAGLGPAELVRMRGYFASAIKVARAAKPDRAYRELLGEVLDYRRWRTFSFYLHPPTGVIVDDLASQVLVMNLPAAGTGLGEWLDQAPVWGCRCGSPSTSSPHYPSSHGP